MKREYVDNTKYDDKRSFLHSRNKIQKPSNLMTSPSFRSLSIRRITMKIDDTSLQNAITNELHQFGDFTVKVYKLDDEKMALINFKYPSDAFRAYSNKLKILIGSKVFELEPFDSLSSMDSGKKLNKLQSMSLVSMSRNLTSENYHQNTVKYPKIMNNSRSEMDVTPTRTLFLGNLENDIEDHDVLSVFGMFGHIEQIDIKRSPGQIPYAFIKFENVDMAIVAKSKMKNKCIRDTPCKIGFGKMTPSKSLYVGGLGKWSSKNVILDEFTKFGYVSFVFYEEGQNFAIIVYEQPNHANEAVQGIKELPLNQGPGTKKIYLDFISDDIASILKSNIEQISQVLNSNQVFTNSIFSIKELTFFKGIENPIMCLDSRRKDQYDRSDDNFSTSGPFTFEEIIKRSDLIGECRFVMKKSIYPIKIYHISGSKELSDSLYATPSMSLIKRRISLSQEWLSNASTLIKRVINDKHKNLSVMIGCTNEEKNNIDELNENYNKLPLKLEFIRTVPCLIAYLRQKQACVIVNVEINRTESKFDLVNIYIFPPSGFSLSLLKLSAPKLACQVASQNNHVVLLACKV